MSVRPIRPEEVDTVALALARSFERDPFSVWLFGAGAVDALRQTFRAQLRVLYVPKGLGETDATLAGAALWSPPGRVRPTFLQSLRLTPSAMRTLGPQGARKGLRAFNVIESNHPDEPHRYLAVLGVDPGRQRSGIGGALLGEGLRRAEAEGLPVYLDTSKEDNVPYYQRFGFEVIHEFDIPGDGPHMWGMLRRR